MVLEVIIIENGLIVENVLLIELVRNMVLIEMIELYFNVINIGIKIG